MTFKPEQHHCVTPALIVSGAAKLADFVKRVFGAEEVERYEGPDGTLHHAELRIGDSIVMMGEAQGMEPLRSGILVYVKDVDAAYERAIRAGATSLEAPKDQFYGARVGRVIDSWGNYWGIATQKENLSPEEIRRRAETAMKERS